MAFSRKGKRRIVVDGNAYLWSIGKLDYDSSPHKIMLTIYRDCPSQKNEQRLHCRLLWNPVMSVTPSKVRMAIENAFANGWDAAVPDIPGVEVWRGYEEWKASTKRAAALASKVETA